MSPQNVLEKNIVGSLDEMEKSLKGCERVHLG